MTGVPAPTTDAGLTTTTHQDATGLEGFATTEIEVGAERLQVALAETADQRSQGLRRVEELPGGLDGMLFTWPEPTATNFGMRDTLIPLDIWWFDSEGVLLGSTEMQPCTGEPCLSYSSPGPVMWALETPLGQYELSPGATLSTVESG